jgi:hypothetical protein
MGIKKNDFDNTSIEQYCPPLNFELAGKRFDLVMDDGYDIALSFLDETTLEWSRGGEPPMTDAYKCLKGDDTTYFVSFEPAGTKLRECHTYILDKENMLVTRMTAVIGLNPKLPYLTNAFYVFGAIAQEGKPLTFKRHSFTSDLIGTAVQWQYSCGMHTYHLYYCADFYRLGVDPDTEDTGGYEAFGEYLYEMMPGTDEPTTYIKIKEDMYLTSLIEQNMERVVGARIQYRSDSLCFLQNYHRMYQVGRAFGTLTTPEGDKSINVMLGAYGKLREVDDHQMSAPNPFVV